MALEGDTIFALSSGRLPAAIAVVRISGPNASVALEALIRRVPEPRRAKLVRVRDPARGEDIDQALALWFPGPNSETGEDMAELHLHGGRAVLAAVLGVLGGLKGLRLAEPGEFTRRAFENGRMDLTAVEGLADLIYAETEAQRRQAYCQMRGLLGDRAEAWRARLIEALALVEAGIDFSDEADVPANLLSQALATARTLRDDIAGVLAGAKRGERLRDGLVVAIAGPPNAGKSTLLNRIAQREAAIVSPIAGTTRDVIEVHLDLGGYPVTLVDTAGIRDTDSLVEQEGVRRARQRTAQADLILWVVDVGEPPNAYCEELPDGTVWMVLNKVDLPKIESEVLRDNTNLSFLCFRVSAMTGAGMDGLIQAIHNHAEAFFGGESSIVTRERHRKLLTDVVEALNRACLGQEVEITAEELRLASTALGKLTGRVDVEDILDVIFRDFCIGK